MGHAQLLMLTGPKSKFPSKYSLIPREQICITDWNESSRDLMMLRQDNIEHIRDTINQAASLICIPRNKGRGEELFASVGHTGRVNTCKNL